MPALIFDCDGVLADTERYGHLPAFNRAFSELGIPLLWSDQEYSVKVRIGGGKERMASAITREFLRENGLPDDEVARTQLIGRLYEVKSAYYREIVESGVLPSRPGVRRLATEAREAGWQLAVASTSAERSVRAVLNHVVGTDTASLFQYFCGDIVLHKKPAPDIYELAVSALGVRPESVVVIEDSANGLAASLAAGLRTIVTISAYTREDDFTGASLVVDSLGEPSLGITSTLIADPHHLVRDDAVDLQSITKLRQLSEERIP